MMITNLPKVKYNTKTMENIERYQTCDSVHELTCNCGKTLFAAPDKDKKFIVLKCAFCDYVQNWIPEFVINFDETELKQAQNNNIFI